MKKILFFVFGLSFLTPNLDVRAAGASDEFIFNNAAEPETLDPHRMSSVDAFQHVTSMLEGLVSRNQDALTLRPALAEKWNISKDGKTYTFTLRKNLKWSNGDALTV